MPAASLGFGALQPDGRGPSWTVVYLTLALVWSVSAIAGGAALAALARRAQPGLSFRKLWIFFALLLAFAVAAYLGIAIHAAR